MIFNVYKEKNWTSFDVVKKLRSVLGVKKIGHAGTLDPLAEGVLVVLTDKDTKKQDEIMRLDKEYKACIAFGATSPTYDLEGDLTFYDIPAGFDLEKELAVFLPKYIGKFEQTAPPYSAKKVKGKKLYERMRKGEVIAQEELPSKEIEISSIEMNEFGKFPVMGKELPLVYITVVCGHGTYIRSLACDLGKDLGIGGVLVDLVRTRIGDYKVEDSMRVEEFVNLE